MCLPLSSLQAPPPSVHPGISVLEAQDALSRQQKRGSRLEGAPPTYNEAIGHLYRPPSVPPGSNHRTVSSLQAPTSSFIQGLLRPPPPQQGSADNRNVRNTKEKNTQKPQQVWQFHFSHLLACGMTSGAMLWENGQDLNRNNINSSLINNKKNNNNNENSNSLWLVQGLLLFIVAIVNITNQAKEQEAAPPALLLRKPHHS